MTAAYSSDAAEIAALMLSSLYIPDYFECRQFVPVVSYRQLPAGRNCLT